MTIVNEDSRVITKLETSLSDNARVVIYDRHMFIVQATDDLDKNHPIIWKIAKKVAGPNTAEIKKHVFKQLILVKM